MAKKIQGYIKLQVPAGQANPSPPIGPALGQQGVNIMEFCKQFNALTQKMEQGMPIPVVITVYADRSFTFVSKSPPASYFIKKAAKIESGSKTPGRDSAGKVIPRNIITDFVCTYNGDEIFRATLYPAISANPFITFHTVATESGTIAFQWTGDNGFSSSAEAKIIVE